MTNLNSLFLSQAYKDCWDDYNRSLKLRSFPRWDYVILTASNEQQAEGFRKQIADRQKFLPRGTKFVASRIVMAGVSVPVGLRWRI